MSNKIEVIAEIVPGGPNFPVVSAENVKVGNDTLDNVTAKIPAIVVSATQPTQNNCLWIQPTE